MQPSTRSLKGLLLLNYYLTINILVLFTVVMQFNNQKLIKFLPQQLTTSFVKTAVALCLFAYWGLIIVGTFLQFI